MIRSSVNLLLRIVRHLFGGYGLYLNQQESESFRSQSVLAI